MFAQMVIYAAFNLHDFVGVENFAEDLLFSLWIMANWPVAIIFCWLGCWTVWRFRFPKIIVCKSPVTDSGIMVRIPLHGYSHVLMKSCLQAKENGSIMAPGFAFFTGVLTQSGKTNAQLRDVGLLGLSLSLTTNTLAGRRTITTC